MGIVLSNPEYFRSSVDLNITNNAAIYKQVVITNTSNSASIDVTLTATQTVTIPQGETRWYLFEGTNYFLLNEEGTGVSLQTHIADNITNSNTVHGIQQGTGNGFDADTVDGFNLDQDVSTTQTPRWNEIKLRAAQNGTSKVTFQEEANDRFDINFDESNDNLEIKALNDDGTDRDVPVQISRTNDGTFTIDRPVTLGGDLDLGSNNITNGTFLGTTTTTSITGSSTDSEIPTAEAVREYVTATGGGTIPDGDSLAAGDVLFADGTSSEVTSRGDDPFIDIDQFYYEPATLIIDGEIYNNPFVQFPGRAGMKGIFENFPNGIAQISSQWNNLGTATKRQEDEWIVIGNGATAGSQVVSNTFSLSGTRNATIRLRVKNINATTTRINGAGFNNIDITWGASRNVTYGANITNLNTQFISDNIVEISVQYTSTASTDEIRVIADPSNANREVKVSRIQAVNYGNDTVLQFPFHAGLKSPDELTYYHEWGTEGTIELWAYVGFDFNTHRDHFFFDNRLGNSANINSIICFYQGSTSQFILQHHDTAGERDQYLTTAYTSSTWIGRGFHHFKITYSTTTQNDNALYIDGGSDSFSTKGTADGTYNLNPRINVGYALFSSPDGHWNGFIDDIRWSPTVDSTTTHHTNNRPYYITTKSYNTDNSYSVDSNGFVSVRDINGINLPGKFELIWQGLDGAPDLFLETGFYVFEFSETNVSDPPLTISVFGYFQAGTSRSQRLATYTTSSSSGIIPNIVPSGEATLDGIGGSFPGRVYRRIWRMQQ